MSVQEWPQTTEDTQRTEDERGRVRQRRMDRLARRWWGRRFVNLFLCWHLFALSIWLLPYSGVLVQACAGVVRPYMVGTAFSQSWNMFSPNPDHLDVYLEARITYQSGNVRTWTFPRLAHMKSYARRYQQERWRKMIEVATHGDNHVLWPALARYAARVNNPDPQNLPVSVLLMQHSREIPPPGQPIPPFKVEPLKHLGHPSVTAIRPEDL